MVLVLGVFAIAACSQASPTDIPTPTVNKAAIDGDRVAVHYTGTLDNGEEFDSSRDRGTLSFVLGAGEMIPGFDTAVNGMKVGDSKTVRMEPKDAYGEPRDDLIIEFPIDQLPEGQGEGDSVLFQDGRQGVILEITTEVFRVDVNHRLAGQALTFEIELVSIE
jgi:peptide-methionine (S)-S-oxide reductase